MVNFKKVIAGLKCCSGPIDDCECSSKCPYWSYQPCAKTLKEDALYLLERLMPVKPIIVNGVLECGECRYELRKDADSYCPCCGKKIEWQNED